MKRITLGEVTPPMSNDINLHKVTLTAVDIPLALFDPGPTDCVLLRYWDAQDLCYDLWSSYYDLFTYEDRYGFYVHITSEGTYAIIRDRDYYGSVDHVTVPPGTYKVVA